MGEYPLLDAVAVRDLQWMEELLSEGADVNAAPAGRNTALYEVAGQRDADVECVRLLLAHGADVSKVGRFGDTPLECAVAWDRADITKLMLEAGANDTTKNRALMKAVCAGPELVKLLLDAGADVDFRAADDPFPGRTPLHEALTSVPYPEVVSLLLEAGAPVNARDDSGKTPLIEACDHLSSPERREAVRMLLDAGADLHAESNGSTALEYAAWNGNHGCVNLLVKRGAQVDWKTLDIAKRLAFWRLLLLVVTGSANWTGSFWATAWGWLKALVVLALVALVLLIVFRPETFRFRGVQTPVHVTVRESLVGVGNVVQVTNDSSKTLRNVVVTATNPKLDQQAKHTFERIEPGEMKELGWLEWNWTMAPGEKITVDADGHLPIVFTSEQLGVHGPVP